MANLTIDVGQVILELASFASIVLGGLFLIIYAIIYAVNKKSKKVFLKTSLFFFCLYLALLGIEMVNKYQNQKTVVGENISKEDVRQIKQLAKEIDSDMRVLNIEYFECEKELSSNSNAIDIRINSPKESEKCLPGDILITLGTSREANCFYYRLVRNIEGKFQIIEDLGNECFW